MARVKNKVKYPLKNTPNNDDYVIGSDSENNGVTVNFRLGSLLSQTGTEGNFVPKGGYTGSGQDLFNAIPTKTSDLTNDGESGVIPFLMPDDLGVVAFTNNYNDLSNLPAQPIESPFTSLDEGSGIGIRITTRNPVNFGNIGDDAFDISYSSGISSVRGATGTGSLAIGEDVIASGYGAYSIGYLIDNSAIYSLGLGLNNKLGGYATNVFGVGHQVSGLAPFVVGQAANVIDDNILDWNAFPNKIQFAIGNGTIANADTEYTVLTRSNSMQVRYDGSIEAPSVTNTIIDADATGKILTTKEWVEANTVGAPQDLQSVLETGNMAEFDAGNSFIRLMSGTENNRSLESAIWNNLQGLQERTSIIVSNNDNTYIQSIYDGVNNIVGINNGVLKLRKQIPTVSGGGSTEVILPVGNISIVSQILFPTPTVSATYILATEDQTINESGQVKVNYTGLTTTGFTAEVVKTLNINAATPTVVSSPTTTFPVSTPNSYVGVFDSARGTSPTGRLIENPINGQTHTWRIQLSFSGKVAGNNGALDLILTNPVSGFQYVMATTLPSGRTAGVINVLAITIADGASIPSPSGYILQAITSFTDATLAISIDSITRISHTVD